MTITRFLLFATASYFQATLTLGKAAFASMAIARIKTFPVEFFTSGPKLPKPIQPEASCEEEKFSKAESFQPEKGGFLSSLPIAFQDQKTSPTSKSELAGSEAQAVFLVLKLSLVLKSSGTKRSENPLGESINPNLTLAPGIGKNQTSLPNINLDWKPTITIEASSKPLFN
jgi:hypothetical protein